MPKVKSAKLVAYVHPKTSKLLRLYVEAKGGHISGTIEQIITSHLLKQPFIQSYLTNQLQENTQNA